MKAYIILEAGYEYNDEYYYRPESEGGTPKNTFLDKEKAEKKQQELEIEQIRGLSLGHYGYEASDISDFPEELTQFFKDEFDQIEEKGSYPEFTVPMEATDKQIIKLIDLIDLEFYSVFETDVEE